MLKDPSGRKRMTTTVAIVDDSAGVRESWSRLINTAPGYECVATCTSGEEALKRIPKLRPDVVLMDIQMAGMNGIETTARLKAASPEVQILMVTVHGDNDRVFSALQAGANGYLLKRSARQELLNALDEVRRGGAPMTSEIARKVIETFRVRNPDSAETATLTTREEEVLEHLTKGYANKEIADKLSISYDTVRNHLRHIYEKLHVRCRTEAATKYLMSSGRSGSGG
jgi:DNA-binding NarL/FixJ family response regulator